MPTRMMTGTIMRSNGTPWARGTLRVQKLVLGTRPGEVYPSHGFEVRADSAGEIPATPLAVPETGTWLRRITFPDETSVDFYLGAGDPITIDEIIALAGVPASEADTPAGELLLAMYDGLEDATDGQVWTAVGAGAAAWEDAPGAAGGIPPVSPAVAGNLVRLLPDGTLEDAGYAADASATGGSVVRRTDDGNIAAKNLQLSGTELLENVDAVIDAAAISVPPLIPYIARFSSGNFGTRGIRLANSSTSIYWEHFGATAAQSRIDARSELGLGSAAVLDAGTAGAAVLVAETGATARAAIGAETSGAAATVQGNLDTHTGATGAGVHGAGATGAAVLAAATEATARAAILAASLRPTQTDVAGVTHTFDTGNEGQIVAAQSASATVFTIPLNASQAFPVGAIVGVEQHGAGALTITATAGVTLNGVDGASEALAAQWSPAAIRKIGTDSWVIVGALA